MANRRRCIQPEVSISKEKHFDMLVDLIAHETLRITQKSNELEKDNSTVHK